MLSAPRAAKKPHVNLRHGTKVDDPYSWLKDPRWQEVLKDPSQLDPEIRAYLDAENAYLKTTMQSTEAEQEKLVAELKARMKQDDATVPARDGPWEYFSKFETGRQYPIYQRRSVADPKTVQVVLDVNALATGHAYCKVPSLTHSPDHRLVAYSVDFKGSERYEIRIRDIIRGIDLPDVITDAGSGAVWSNDSLTLYYIIIDEQQRPRWVKRHRLGNPLSRDELLYEEADVGFFLGLSKSESKEFIVLDAHDHVSSEVHVLPAFDESAVFRCIERRKAGVIYDLTHNGGDFYLAVHEGAQKDGRIVKLPVNAGRAAWKDVVPFQAGRLIQSMIMFKDYLVRLELTDALPRIAVRHLASGVEQTVEFPEAAYQLSLIPGYEFETETLRFSYSSMATPEQTFDYELAKKTRKLLKQQEVPSGHDPSDYVLERMYATARDGQTVPISLLRHKDHRSGKEPLLLYGYGSYGMSMPASFSTHRLSLVNRGISYAIAHIRGGKDKGYAWYEGAKLLTKKKTFEDFVDSGEFLAKANVTSRGRIVGHGGSAGGMLMGAVANMAPDLFLGIVADVPFVDVLNTMWDKDLPLTPPEWPEWGNPIESHEAHEYIGSYSPYDQVQAKAYPNMLILAGLTDPRVTYWEPAKWVAKLRELKTDQRLLVFDVNMGAGHGGASGRFDILKKVALIYAFVLKIVQG